MSEESKEMRERAPDGASLMYCDSCDGCGWYEGGKKLQTTCEVCSGTGTVPSGERERKRANKGSETTEEQDEKAAVHRGWRVSQGDCDFCFKNHRTTITLLWQPKRVTICRDCVDLAHDMLPNPDTLVGERAAPAAPSSPESSEYLRGRERGIEEAARRCETLSHSPRGNDYGSVGNTFDECAEAIRALSGNASDSSPSSLSDPSPLVVQENQQGACGAKGEDK